jgi:hypothetical protein
MDNNKIELGEHDVFQRFYDLISKHFERGDLYVDLHYLQFKLQELEKLLKLKNKKKNNPRADPFNLTFDSILFKFVRIFEIRGFKSDMLYNSFFIYLHFLHLLVQNSSNVKNENEINHNFFAFFPSLKRNFNINIDQEFMVPTSEDYWGIEKFEIQLAKDIGIGSYELDLDGKASGFHSKDSFLIYCDKHKAKKFKWDSFLVEFIFIKELWYLDIELMYRNNTDGKVKVSDFSYSMWAITSAIEQIKDVDVEIEEIRRGSVLVKIKVWIGNLLAKEEVKELLQYGKDAALAKLVEKPFNESIKLKNEAINFAAQTKKIEQEIALNLSQEENELKKSLAFERTKLENEKFYLENEKLKIENQRVKIQMMSELFELVKLGILTPEMLQIKINETLFITNNQGRVSSGTKGIDEIME